MNPNFLNKTYESFASENFDAYMKEIGLSYIACKLGKMMQTTETIKENGKDKYDLIITACLINHVTTFKLGEVVTRDLLDGRKNVTSVFTVKGDALHEQQHCPSTNDASVLIRIYNGNEMKMKLTANEISAIRFHKLIRVI